MKLLQILSIFACFLVALATAQDYTCSADKPCALGCCSNTGVCGLGPTFCGAGNCTSSCDQKSECDPGWGSEWSSAENCPLNVCCSAFGFCGTTSDFCGTKTVTKPSCSGTSSNQRTIGYYEGWSTTRACDGMYPENIPSGAYTHLNYAFAFVDPDTFAVAPMADTDKDLYPRFTALKETNAGLETWISIGGWSMNDPDQPTARTFSNLAASQDAQNKFFSSLLSFMGTYGFDGVDIDWEYPVAEERSGIPADYDNYVTFLRNLKSAFAASGHKYGLTITVPSSYWYLQHFDIVSISKIIDWFNVMTYDLHGTWDSTIQSLGPEVRAHTNLTEIDQTMDLFWRNNIDPAQIVMGLGFYGRSFTLTDPSCTAAGCGFSAGGDPGECTASAGTLSFAEIQRIVADDATVTLDKDAGVQIVVFDNDQWVSYDDSETFKIKLDYANGLCLGGTMVWAASTDDALGTAASAMSETTGRMALSLKQTSRAADTFTSCVWGECAKSGETTCPENMSAAQTGSGKTKGNVGIYNACPSGQERAYCCPSDDVPTCTWRGHGINCSAEKCTDDEVEVTTHVGGCFLGHTRLCCKKTASDAAIGTCKWEGASPFCSVAPIPYGCDESDRFQQTYDSYGAGGEMPCIVGFKSMCCTEPAAFTGCSWVSSSSIFHIPFVCDSQCPSGKTPIASDTLGCLSGSSFYCCDNPTSIPDAPVNTDFCYSTEGDFVETNEPDESNDAKDILELYWYEDECYDIPNTADPSVQKRAQEMLTAASLVTHSQSNHSQAKIYVDEQNYFELPVLDPWVQDLLHESLVADLHKQAKYHSHQDYHRHSVAALEERGSSRLSKICLSNGQQVNTFSSLPYPGVTGILKNSGKVVFGAASTGACFGLTLGKAAYSAVQAGVKLVTEHVTELQTPKQWMNSMLSSTLQSGNAATALRYNPLAVFQQGGYIDLTFGQLGVQVPGFDSTTKVSKAIFAILGTSSDFDNFQVLTAKENSLKTAMWGLFVNINSDKKWLKMSPQTQVDIINRISVVVEYLNSPEGQTSLTLTYNKFRYLLRILDNSGVMTIVNPNGLTLENAFVEYYGDFFQTMEANVIQYVQRRLPDMILFWQSTAGQSLKNPLVAAAMVTNLQGKLQNAATDLAINYGFI